MKEPGLTWNRYFIAIVLAIFLALSVRQAAEAASANETTAFQFFTDTMGLTPAAACGIMSNISAESGFQANINGLGGAYGICQWTGSRLSRLRSWCSANGWNYTTLTGQLYFLQYEVKTTYPNVYNYITSVPNTAAGAYNAGFYWCYYYERPANTYSVSVYRAGRAQSVYWSSIGASSTYLTISTVSKGAKLSWNSSGVYACEVKRATKLNGKYKTVASLSKSTKKYTDKDIKVGKKYYYYIEFVTKKGVSVGRSNKVSCSVSRSMKDGECVIKLAKTSYTYDGKAKKPKVTVYYDGKKLKKGKDYSVAYSANKNAGTAKVKVSGIGNYCGTKTLTFTIEKAKQKIKLADLETACQEANVKLKAKASGKGKLKYSVADTEIAEIKKGALAAKKPGITTLTVKAAATENYKAAEKTVKLTVLPGKPVISKLSKQGETGMLVKWKKAAGIEGYELQYVKGSDFESGAKTIKISSAETGSFGVSGLKKGKNYSFRIRSYAVLDGKKIFSAWSSIKSAKIS